MIVDWLYLALYAAACMLVVLIGMSAGGFIVWARDRLRTQSHRRPANGRRPHLRIITVENQDSETIESRRVHK